MFTERARTFYDVESLWAPPAGGAGGGGWPPRVDGGSKRGAGAAVRYYEPDQSDYVTKDTIR